LAILLDSLRECVEIARNDALIVHVVSRERASMVRLYWKGP
jgi:hypothetical protein